MVVCIPKRSDLFYIYRDFDDVTRDWAAFSIDAISSDKKAMKILFIFFLFKFIKYIFLYFKKKIVF